MVDDFGSNFSGHRPRLMSPEGHEGASIGITAALMPPPLTRTQCPAAYHSRQPPASSSRAGLTVPFCPSYSNSGCAAAKGNAKLSFAEAAVVAWD
jgi:hypothetical protein